MRICSRAANHQLEHTKSPTASKINRDARLCLASAKIPEFSTFAALRIDRKKHLVGCSSMPSTLPSTETTGHVGREYDRKHPFARRRNQLVYLHG
jgi:hypothetical protein